jgi:hypothetical protein
MFSKRKATEPTETPSLPLAKRRAIDKTDYFRFLDLPAELRNRIYKFTMEGVSRTAISRNRPTDAPGSRRRNFRRLRGVAYSTNKLRMSPFLGLLQICQAIRSEYRPWYIGQSPMYVSNMQIYFHVFIERPKLNWKRAYDIFHESLQSIGIVLSRCEYVDLLPLLRLKARHPSTNIEVAGGGDQLLSRGVEPFRHVFIDNQNKTWLSWINTGAMTQARLTIRDPFWPLGAFIFIHVVLRRRSAEKWEAERQRDERQEVGKKVQPLHDIQLWELEEKNLRGVGLQVSFGIAE